MLSNTSNQWKKWHNEQTSMWKQFVKKQLTPELCPGACCKYELSSGSRGHCSCLWEMFYEYLDALSAYGGRKRDCGVFNGALRRRTVLCVCPEAVGAAHQRQRAGRAAEAQHSVRELALLP